MVPKVQLLQSALSDLFAQANTTGYLTLGDRYGLMAAILDESLSDEERRCVDRLIRSVYRGRIKMINEFSHF